MDHDPAASPPPRWIHAGAQMDQSKGAAKGQAGHPPDDRARAQMNHRAHPLGEHDGCIAHDAELGRHGDGGPFEVGDRHRLGVFWGHGLLELDVTQGGAD
jgi:hypothetical protein